MRTPSPDATTRFSSRVDDYVRYRPTYPREVIAEITAITGVQPGADVADLGAGTGIFSGLWLGAGYQVWAVEPNAAMRLAAEAQFAGHHNFHSRSGTAEATGLAPAAVDLVVAAQAFHWFDVLKARVECQRILRIPAWVALVWNSRQLLGSPFLEAYEALLLRHATDYSAVRHENVDAAALAQFFGGPFETRTMANRQRLDRAGLQGRLRSTSYVPGPGQPGYEALMQEAEDIFDRCQSQGVVDLEYTVQIYVGQLA